MCKAYEISKNIIKSNYIGSKLKTLHFGYQSAHARPLLPHTLRISFMINLQNTVISPVSCVTVHVQGVQITNGLLFRKIDRANYQQIAQS